MWTDAAEESLRRYSVDCRGASVWAQRWCVLWSMVAWLYVPVGVLAWIFGTGGLAGMKDGSSNAAADVVLVVTGATIVALDQIKPRKRKAMQKTRLRAYKRIMRRIEATLARTREERKSPDAIFLKIQAETKALELGVPLPVCAMSTNVGV